MKKILFVLSTIVLFAFTLLACNKGTSGSVGSGKVLVINLETNPTTGYDWQYEMNNQDADAAVIIFQDANEELTNNDKGLVGAPIIRHYRFAATKQGKQAIKFTYKRNWEGGDTAYSIVYDITVGSDLKIHVNNVSYEGDSSNNIMKNEYTYED